MCHWIGLGLRDAFLLVILVVCPLRLSAAPPRTEAQLIEMLRSTNSTTVIEALDRLPVWYPNNTNAIPIIRGLLKDPDVKRRAALALGNYHAELPLQEVKIILGFLRSPEANEAQDGLKALRGLKEPEVIREKIAADILPLLQDKNIHVVRDACRTLGVVGSKDAIPAIEPLLKHSRMDVKRDAKAAISQLREKP